MPMPTIAYPHLAIDWYADGDFTDPFDDLTDRVLGRPGMTVQWGRDTARSTSPPMIATAECDLNNQDGMLSPENGASPAYQFIKPGRPALVSVGHGERRLLRSHWLLRSHVPLRGIGIWPLLLGHLDRFEQHPEWGVRTVHASLLDQAARLLRKRISCPYAGDTRTDTAAEAVLNAVGWPYDKRDLHVSDAVMNGWWVDERPAWDVLVELLATEGAGAAFYVDGFGTFHWLNRNHRVTQPRSTTTQAVFHDGTASGIPYSSLTYDPRWDDIIDRVTVTTTQRALDASPSVVWKLGKDLTVLANQVETIIVRPQDPFQFAIKPVVTTDYTVSGGTIDINLSWDQGAVVLMYVTGLTGTSTISNLQLRAYSMPVVGETDYEVRADLDVVVGEEKTLKLDVWPQLDPAQAKAIADSYALRYRESRPIIELTFENVSGDVMEKILDLRLSDRVTITHSFLGLASLACWVEQITHEMTVGGRHQVTLACEPVFAIGTGGGVWDAAIWDTSTWGI